MEVLFAAFSIYNAVHTKGMQIIKRGSNFLLTDVTDKTLDIAVAFCFLTSAVIGIGSLFSEILLSLSGVGTIFGLIGLGISITMIVSIQIFVQI